MALSEKLLQLRTAHRLSQGDLAEKLEVSRQSVSKWETGQSVPDLDKIIKLADLYEITVDELVREDIQPKVDARPNLDGKKKREFVLPWLEDPENQKNVGYLCAAGALLFLILCRWWVALALLSAILEVMYCSRATRLPALYFTALAGAVLSFGLTGAAVMLIVLLFLIFVMGWI